MPCNDIEVINIINNNSVSYTHLDVYKRQIIIYSYNTKHFNNITFNIVLRVEFNTKGD